MVIFENVHVELNIRRVILLVKNTSWLVWNYEGRKKKGIFIGSTGSSKFTKEWAKWLAEMGNKTGIEKFMHESNERLKITLRTGSTGTTSWFFGEWMEDRIINRPRNIDAAMCYFVSRTTICVSKN